MLDILNIVPNEPKTDLKDYFILVYGVGKSGKTTLFYELAKTEYVGGLDKALLLAFEEGKN